MVNYFIGDDDDDDDDSDSDESADDSLFSKKKKNEVQVGDANTGDLVEKARQQAEKIGVEDKLAKMLICCGCLGERSDDVNEIVECDGCGVTVHEGRFFF